MRKTFRIFYVENEYDDDGDGSGHRPNDCKHTVEIEFSLFGFFSSDSYPLYCCNSKVSPGSQMVTAKEGRRRGDLFSGAFFLRRFFFKRFL